MDDIFALATPTCKSVSRTLERVSMQEIVSQREPRGWSLARLFPARMNPSIFSVYSRCILTNTPAPFSQTLFIAREMAVQVSLLLSEVITLRMTALHTDLHLYPGARGVTFDIALSHNSSIGMIIIIKPGN